MNRTGLWGSRRRLRRRYEGEGRRCGDWDIENETSLKENEVRGWRGVKRHWVNKSRRWESSGARVGEKKQSREDRSGGEGRMRERARVRTIAPGRDW